MKWNIDYEIFEKYEKAVVFMRKVILLVCMLMLVV
jgi:hypothetical protein